MVDYSKWNNLDSDDSDSDSGSVANPAVKAREVGAQPEHGPMFSQPEKSCCGQGAGKTARGSDRKRILEQAEILRMRGNSAFETGDLGTALGAYESQIELLEGRTDEAAIVATCGALLNQASGLIKLTMYAEAEARCTRLLGCISTNKAPQDIAAARTRALHFRGFARLRQGKHEEARRDLEEALEGRDARADEAKALLAEAEAGTALSSCPDAEARGRELLREGNGREASRLFQEAASRARRRCDEGAAGKTAARAARVALARSLRMKAVAIAATGDSSSAEMLLKGRLQELQGGAGAQVEKNERALTLSALGSLLSQRCKHGEAVGILREAVLHLDEVLAFPPDESQANEEDSNSTGKRSLVGNLIGTLYYLGVSLLALHGPSDASDEKSDGQSFEGAPDDSLSLEKPMSTASGPGYSPGIALCEEAAGVFARALDLMRNEVAGINGSSASAAGDGRRDDSHDDGVAGGVPPLTGGPELEGAGRSENAVRKQMASVLDLLSEAHARQKKWEKARSAAEQSLTAWRSLGTSGRAGAAATLLSLGHLTLQLHGVDAGIGEASARWEEAAALSDEGSRPAEAADIRLKVAGFYTKVARFNPSQLESVEEHIAAHFSKAAGLFARQRQEKTDRLKLAGMTVNTPLTQKPGTVLRRSSSVLAAPARDSLEADGPSCWELAQQEALAWEGYAGAVGDDHCEAAEALRKACEALDIASVSERDEAWTLRIVGVLQSLALALAQRGDRAMAEEKLLRAIGEMQGLDGVDFESEKSEHKDRVIALHKFLAIARRAQGDLPGARKALQRVHALGGISGRADVEGLNELLAHNRISLE